MSGPRGRKAPLRTARALAGAGFAWGLFEAQWVERRTLDVPVPGLPPALDGLRILHLSDFHLGSPSLNTRSLANAVDWASAQEVDLVAITGDLLSRARGEETLRAAVRRLRARHGTYVVLGNHDVGFTRDPFSTAREVGGLDPDGAVLLRDRSAAVEIAGLKVQIVGVDPATFLAGSSPLDQLTDRDADLRILLCHFPRVVDRLRPGAYELVLAGDVHGGQICLPLPGGKLRFGGFRQPYPEGVFELPGTTLVVSRGTGTAFVPFRFFARPEAAILVLHPSPRRDVDDGAQA
jgi:predicted MPP superfamily phosphohydrolase